MPLMSAIVVYHLGLNAFPLDKTDPRQVTVRLSDLFQFIYKADHGASSQGIILRNASITVADVRKGSAGMHV